MDKRNIIWIYLKLNNMLKAFFFHEGVGDSLYNNEVIITINIFLRKINYWFLRISYENIKLKILNPERIIVKIINLKPIYI